MEIKTEEIRGNFLILSLDGSFVRISQSFGRILNGSWEGFRLNSKRSPYRILGKPKETLGILEPIL